MTKIGKIFIWVIVLVAVVLVVYFLGRDVKNEKTIDKTLPAYNYENQILGKSEDLLSFTILPGAKMPNGILSYRGSIKGGWFFEGNILINILDQNKVPLLQSNAVATSDWMTAEAVDFEGNVDFTNLPKGPAYFEIHNDNASGEPEFDKFIQIPIVIE